MPNTNSKKRQDMSTWYQSTVKKIFNSQLFGSYAFIERVMEQIPKKLKAEKMYHIDINKCRKNQMYYAQYEYPVFSVMDQPTEYNGQTGAGLYFVETESYFPLRGNGWYYEPMIKYCLEQNIIKSDNIKYVVKASLCIDAKHYNSFIDMLYLTLDDKLKKTGSQWYDRQLQT